jgi:hypothetical protein
MATTPSNLGYWILDAYTGAVSAYGDANSYGDRTASNTGGADLWPISIALVPTSDGKGYWILDVGLSGLGSVRAYGDAISYGDQTDVAGITGINGRPVDMAATPDGKGYWIVDSDGGGLRLRRCRLRRVDGRSTDGRRRGRDGPQCNRQRILAGGGRRRSVRLRRSAVPRIDGRATDGPTRLRHRHPGTDRVLIVLVGGRILARTPSVDAEQRALAGEQLGEDGCRKVVAHALDHPKLGAGNRRGRCLAARQGDQGVGRPVHDQGRHNQAGQALGAVG